MTLLSEISGPAPAAAERAAARAIGATKIYGKGDGAVIALDRVDVDFAAGAFTAIMGPSGSGKSTLMHCLAGLDELTNGQVLIGDVDLTTLSDKHLTVLRRDKVGFIFQAYNLVPTLTALENITLPMDLAGRKPDEAWLSQVVETIGLRDRLQHRPSELSGVRERVDTATLDRISAVVGVDAAAGSIEGQAALVEPDGKAKAGTAFGGVIGANWVADQRLNPFTIATGRAPRAPGEAVLDQSTFESDNHALGDTIIVLGKGAPRQLSLVGTATYGDVGGLPGVTLVAVTDATAQELFAEPGAYDRVLVASDGSVSDGALSGRIAADLSRPDTYEVVTGAADTASSKADLKENLGFFSTFLLAFAYIALFVGMFIIYNTFSIVVAQRAREMAMLRAIGASRAQVVRSVVFESVVVGVVASAAGLGVGVLMSFGLRVLLSAVGLEVPGGPIVIAPSTVITAFVVGIVITVASALLPAVRSSRVKPIAALRDVAIDGSGSSVARTGAGTAVLEADPSALPEVETVSPVRSSPIGIGHGSSEVAAIDTRTIGRVADLGVTAGSLADVSGLSIAVEDRKAKADKLTVGDKLTVTFARTGPVELTIRALIDRPPPGLDGIVYVIGLDTYKANVTDQFDRQVFVKVADGVSPMQAKAALDTVLAGWPNGELRDQAAFEEGVASEIDIILNLIYGLLGLAILIALIGIANTLALSVHERRRELGLLRAVGMTRSQVRSAVRWESVMIALMGTFLGFSLAVAGAWGIISAIEADRPIPLAVPPVQLAVIVVLASVAGVLAAVGPARRAAKLDILSAIAGH